VPWRRRTSGGYNGDEGLRAALPHFGTPAQASASRRTDRLPITAHERMADAKLRQAIALEAARLMYERLESEYFTAKRKAAKRLCRRGVKPADLPSNAEIRDQIQVFARIYEGDKRTEHLREMRLEALRLM